MTYDEDLAYIHHAGFSEFAESAAPGLLEMLWKHGIRDGLAVDYGCGSGVWARELTRAGYTVLGIDASPAMIAIARTIAPHAQFMVGSSLPREARAITAIGEVLNYVDIRAFIPNAAAALSEGGLLIFDIAERGSYPPHDERRVEGDDWIVDVYKDSDGERLTRRVLTYREIGGVVRRSEEVHELELYDREEILRLLRGHAFRVRTRRSYGTRRLPRGHAVYVGEMRATGRIACPPR